MLPSGPERRLVAARRRGLIGATPFLLASKFVNPSIMRALLDAGADPSLQAAAGLTPLMVASGLTQIVAPPARRKDFSLYYSTWDEGQALVVITLLLERGADVRCERRRADRAAWRAYQGADRVVRLLVEHGATLNIQDAEGRTPFRVAEGHLESGLSIESPRNGHALRQIGADTSLGVDAYTLLRDRQLNAAREAATSTRER